MTTNAFARAHAVMFRRFWTAIMLYVLIIFGGSYLINEREPRSAWLSILVALAATIPAVYSILIGQAVTTRYEGVERDLLYRSTSIAFFITMAFSVTTALFATFVRGTAPHPWWFYSVGMLSWLVVTVVIKRRLR